MSVTFAPLTGNTPQSVTNATPPTVIHKRRTKPAKPRPRKCETCRQKFTPKAAHGKFCSAACRQKNYRRKHAAERTSKTRELTVAVCAHCGAPFWLEVGSKALYCSAAHKSAAYRVRRAQAVAALKGDLAMTEEEAQDAVETHGMTATTKHLQQRGYQWRGDLRAWVYAAV